ncbi:Hypothetical predicted protein, partial [Paramuricea clavata]
ADTRRLLCSVFMLYFLPLMFCVYTSEILYDTPYMDGVHSGYKGLFTAKIYGRKFLRRRIRYYSHSSASFNPCILVLELSGDIHPHPGPVSNPRRSGKGRHTLLVLTINARSLNNKLRDFQSMVYTSDCDVVVVSESWLTPSVLNKEILPNGYDIYRCDRQDGKRGGGVLIAIKNEIESKRRKELESNCEIVVCEIHISKGMKLIICGFYRPPSSKNEYLMNFGNSLENIVRDGTPVILCGDFNFPEIDWELQVAPGCDNLPNIFCDMINDAFLSQMNYSPTRVSDSTSNILDLVFTNLPDQLYGLSTFDCQLNTDHLGISFFLKTTVKRTKFSRSVYNFKKADFDGLRETLARSSWNFIFP